MKKIIFIVSFLIVSLISINVYSAGNVFSTKAIETLELLLTPDGDIGAIPISDYTPSDTHYKLYNSSGSLYWNGSAIGSGGSGSFTDLTVSGCVNYTDGTDTTPMCMKTESGESNAELVVGLDEDRRLMVICDAGDMDTDFNLTSSSHPGLYIFNNTGANRAYINYDTLSLSSDAIKIHPGYFYFSGAFEFKQLSDVVAGDSFVLNSGTSAELTDTDGQQAWVSVEPKINQSSTAAYNALEINVTETALGDGTSGHGNNLILAGTSTDPDMFKVSNNGSVYATVGAQYKNISTPDLTGNSYTIASTDYSVKINDDDTDVTGTVVVALPAAASSTGRVLFIKRIGSSQIVRLDGDGSDTIDESLTKDLASKNDSYRIQCDGVTWSIF